MVRLRKSTLLASVVLSGVVYSSMASAKTEILVYTSMYPEYIGRVKDAFEKKYPDIGVKIYQDGSEKVRSRVERELESGKVQGDVVNISEPFFATDLADRGVLHVRAGKSAVENSYFSVMVLVCHKDLPKEKCPKSYEDLTKPAFKGLVHAASPFDSGTMFSAVAILARKYGWDYFKKLRENDGAFEGGSSAVIKKLQSGEKKVGIVLVESALSNIAKGAPIEIVYPSDGAIAIPSVQFIPKGAKNLKEAELFADFLLSVEGQTILRSGNMHSVSKDVPPPQGTKALSEISLKKDSYTPEVLREVGKESKEIKRKFLEVVKQ